MIFRLFTYKTKARGLALTLKENGDKQCMQALNVWIEEELEEKEHVPTYDILVM